MIVFEAIPYSNHNRNLRKYDTKQNWNNVRVSVFKAANNICVACNKASENLECNEVWNFDDKRKIQKLIGFEALCKKCHNATHILNAKPIKDDIIDHFIEVNETDRNSFYKLKKEAKILYEKRRTYTWSINLGEFLPDRDRIFQIDLKDQIKKLKRGRGTSLYLLLNLIVQNQKLTFEDLSLITKVLDPINTLNTVDAISIMQVKGNRKYKSLFLNLLEYSFTINRSLSFTEIYYLLGGHYYEYKEIERITGRIIKKSENKVADFFFILNEFDCLIELANNEKILKQLNLEQLKRIKGKILKIPKTKSDLIKFKKTKLFKYITSPLIGSSKSPPIYYLGDKRRNPINLTSNLSEIKKKKSFKRKNRFKDAENLWD